MINREDMLELTRRMTPKRTCFQRIAGAYIDRNGFVDGTFHTHFGSLSLSEKKKNLAVAKSIPFADTNRELKSYTFSRDKQGQGSMWQLLLGLKECGLKNDAMLEILYEYIGENLVKSCAYALLVFYGSYDVPVKGTDKVRLEESEEVYDFLIVAVCPLEEQYEYGMPDSGFLFPAFVGRSSDRNRVAIYQREMSDQDRSVFAHLLGCEEE